MLGLGFSIPKLRVSGLVAWLNAFIKRVKGDGGTVEGEKCVKADGEFLINNTRAGIIVDAMGKYAATYGGEGLEARACSAQAVNDLIYSPRAQTKFMFLAEDLGTELESYYCFSNSIDDLEGDLAVFGSVTHTYGANASAGAIALSVENGEAPYTYAWSNGSTVEDITGLTKGVYNIQVKDANGALANNSLTVRGDADPSIVTAGLRMDSYFTDSALEFPALGSAKFNGGAPGNDVSTSVPAFTGTDSFTYCAWVYAEVVSASRCIIMSEENTGWGLQGLTIGTSANIYFYAGTGASATSLRTSASGTLPTNTWVFVSATHTQSVNTLYINGSIASQGAASALVTTAGDDYNIGRYSGNRWIGNLANVAVWNRALHPDEINAIMWKSYGDLNAVDKNGLQAWYALDNINGTTVPDSTGNHNGTAN